MANVYININTEEQKRSNIVYTDIAMQSVPAEIRIKGVYVNSYKVGALSADNPSADNYGKYDLPNTLPENYNLPVDYVDRDTTDTFREDKKMYFFGDAIPSAQNVAYNQEARKRAHFKLQKNINVNAVKRAIHNIFSWVPGERTLNPEFGTNLRKYLYEGITTYNKEQIMSEIQRCIVLWEPRAKLLHVYDKSNISDHEHNTVVIEIVYTIPSLTTEQFSYTFEVPI